MNVDRAKQVVASALAFGALAIPHFQEAVTALGGDHAVMQAVTGAYAVYALLRGLVDWLHQKGAPTPTGRKAAVVAALLLAAPGLAFAQEPAPEPDRGGLLATYSLAHPEPAEGRVALEVDVRVAGTALLLVGHVSENGHGAGPQVKHDLGPFTVFGHTLIGSFEYGSMAERDTGLRHGTGIEIPVRDNVVIRIAWDRTTAGGAEPVVASSVGLGWRF